MIKEQACFRPGRSTTGQLLKLTQHIEDGFQTKKITGAVFVDLTAAYDTVNHRLLLQKVLKMTNDLHLTQFLGEMLSNRRFFVLLNNKKSRLRLQKNGLPQGSVLAPFFYNIYTNDQPRDLQTKSFAYADDLCVTSQQPTFSAVEASLANALNGLHQYYAENSLKTNPAKTQVCSFHLKNRDANCPLNIMWNGQKLENCKHPKYLGVTLIACLHSKNIFRTARPK